MARIHIPEIKVDTFIDKIHDGARRRGGWPTQIYADSASSPTSGSTSNSDASAQGSPSRMNVPQLVLQPEFQPNPDDQYHVNDLLRYHDRDFIQNAYRALLKRYPDAGGYEQFLSKLRDGRLNKIDILARLRFSSEGRAKKVHVKGLLLPSVLRRSYSLPVLGYLMRFLVGLARLPHAIRYQQQLEAYVLAQQQMIADYANERGRELSVALEHVSALGQFSGQINSRIDEQQALQEELHAHFSGRLSDLGRETEERFRNESAERREEVAQSAQTLRLMLEQETQRLSEAARADARELSEKIEQVKRVLSEESLRRQQAMSGEIESQERRVTLMLEEMRQRLPAPFATRQLHGKADERDLDAFYVSFEDLFRGSHEDIKERLKVYLPIIGKNGIGGGEMPLLDIGCGRGEWLELLRDEGLHARGVDANRVLIAQCRERGLEAVEADLISYLRELPDNSVGGITGFHVMEHLLPEMLLDVLDETVRVLKPGGALIFETPNPQNLLVGSYYFYFDLTHRKPLPSPTMRFLFEARGLTAVEIIHLHPPPQTDKVEGDSELVKRFNEYFYGPMDYAVVGWKAQG